MDTIKIRGQIFTIDVLILFRKSLDTRACIINQYNAYKFSNLNFSCFATYTFSIDEWLCILAQSLNADEMKYILWYPSTLDLLSSGDFFFLGCPLKKLDENTARFDSVVLDGLRESWQFRHFFLFSLSTPCLLFSIYKMFRRCTSENCCFFVGYFLFKIICFWRQIGVFDLTDVEVN